MKLILGTRKRLGLSSAAARAAAFLLALSIYLLCSGSASAQYTGTMGTGSPSYGSSGKAIGIGVGAAAGGAALLYVAMHHHGSVSGCVSESGDAFRLTEDKTGKTYSLLANGADLKAGESVQLSGKKSGEPEGTQTFEVKKVLKDRGTCQ
jgi:hypothetical protein